MSRGSGNFFAVDHDAWGRACDLGLNTAVFYLVLARGTLRDQKTTAWSVASVERYTGLSRPRAQQALDALVAAGLVKIARGGSKPIYCLSTCVSAQRQAPVLTKEEEAICATVAAGESLVPIYRRADQGWWMTTPSKRAENLVRMGVLRAMGYGSFEMSPPQSEQSNWIWLPNELVTGATGEIPPVERLRRQQNVDLLRLFVDLYHAHSLASDGGLSWRLIRRDYDREKVGECGRFNLWRFSEGNVNLWWKGPFRRLEAMKRQPGANHPIWNLWGDLQKSGVIECVPHLVESDTNEGEIIHPCPTDTGTPTERALGDAVRAASDALANEITEREMENGGGDLIAVPDDMPNVHMVGVYRLIYRPRTRATAAWFGQEAVWKALTARYWEMREQADAGLPITTYPTSLQHQRTSKVINE